MVVVLVEVPEVTMAVEGPIANEWRWWFRGVFCNLVILAFLKVITCP